MALEITDDTFEEVVLQSNKLVVVDFWAVWCGPCKMVGPIMEQLGEEYEGQAVVGKLDVDNNPTVAEKYSIRSIPTVLYFRDGEVIGKIVGASTKSKYERVLEENLI